MSIVARYAVRAMEVIAPLHLAEKWDNVGLLFESPLARPGANRVLLTIDLTPSVLEEALQRPTALVISYHPPIFKPLSSFTLANPLQASLLRLAAAGVSVYSPHTALDWVRGGINDWLARGIVPMQAEQGRISFLTGPMGDDDEGGPGRLVTLQRAVSIEDVVERTKNHLGISYVDVGRPVVPQQVRTIAICAGSGGSMLAGVDADVYFTGEMAHHEVLAAVAAGRYVILCGHTNTERGYLPGLATRLGEMMAGWARRSNNVQEGDGLTHEEQEALSSVVVHVSEADRHPLERV